MLSLSPGRDKMIQMKRLRISISFVLFVIPIVYCYNISTAQELGTCSISYVTSNVVYIDAGKERQLAAGDTLSVQRGNEEIGTIVLFAVSRQSSAAHILNRKIPFVIGDQALGKLRHIVDTPSTVVARNDSSSIISISKTHQPAISENIVRGMVVVQYENIIADDKRLNLSQPALTARLTVDNLFGTGTILSLNTRSIYDASNNYALYGQQTGIQTRAYEVALRRDLADSPIGFGLGRITSRFASGLGSFDGGEIYYRFNAFTAGILGGAQVLDRTLSFSQEGSKGGVFLNYRSGDDLFHRYDGTISYGRQMVSGQLDREFLYTQNQLSLGPDLWIYQSANVELNNLVNGARQTSLSVSSMSLQVHYVPLSWLSADGGYDAYRVIPLYETMKMIPDSLLDRGVFQGVRAATALKLWSSVILTVNGSYGSRPMDGRSSTTYGAGIRVFDVFGSGINSEIRNSQSSGPYADANDLTLDLDGQVFRDLTLTLRGTYRLMNVSLLQQSYKTLTAGLDTYLRISYSWFASLSGEYVYDPSMSSIRIFTEIGFRF
jgi:hypothetical protein